MHEPIGLVVRTWWSAACAALLVTALSTAQADEIGFDTQIVPPAADTTLPAERGPRVPDRAGPGPHAVLQNCATNVSALVGSSRFSPSGVRGGVGETRIVVASRVHVGVYRKDNCAIVSRVPLRQFFSAFNAADDFFELPQALYDPVAKRFLVATLAFDSAGDNLYLAISKDASASQWHLYRLVLLAGSTSRLCGTATAFPSGLIAGQNGRRWFFTLNKLGGAILSVDKAPTLTGAATTVKCFPNLQINVAPPIVSGAATTAYFLSTGTGSGNRIRRFALNSAGAKPASDVLTTTALVVVPAWTAPPKALQPNGQRLETLDGRFVSASVQIGSALWNVHTIKVGDFARWRLYKFSTTATSPLFAFTPSTQPQDFLFNASVATNSAAASGRAFVTFSRTIPSQPNAGRPAMLVGVGPNASSGGWFFNLIATSAQQVNDNCNRFADSACFWLGTSTQMDPVIAGQAWGFGQLATGSKNYDWTTRAAAVR